jgi:aspartate racemase
MLGIVGGIGPMAGADLYKKIVENTIANTDQEHLSVLLASMPNEIADRTSFLLGKSDINPAPALAKIILMLERAGATHIGIACNTAHAPQIFEPMQCLLTQNDSKVVILNMIEETVSSILAHSAPIQRVGILGTSGTYKTRIYQDRLEAAGLSPIILDFNQQESLPQRAIYEIKAASTNVPQHPVDLLNEALLILKKAGAQAIVLGCTELGMIEERLDLQGMAVFNPNLILARTLIRQTYPEKLKG